MVNQHTERNHMKAKVKKQNKNDTPKRREKHEKSQEKRYS